MSRFTTNLDTSNAFFPYSITLQGTGESFYFGTHAEFLTHFGFLTSQGCYPAELGWVS